MAWLHVPSLPGTESIDQSIQKRCLCSADQQQTRLVCPQGEDDGSTVLPVSDYLDARDGERPVGVFALLDARHNTQYVGYSRNMVLAIKVRGGWRCADDAVM